MKQTKEKRETKDRIVNVTRAVSSDLSGYELKKYVYDRLDHEVAELIVKQARKDLIFDWASIQSKAEILAVQELTKLILERITPKWLK